MTDPFIAELQKQGLKGVTAAAESAQVKGFLNSGNLALNWAMSGKFQGGWPLGHVAEIFGDPSTGKSFIIARAIAAAHTAGGNALLDDTESAFNPIWAATGLGVDPTRLAHTKSHTIQDHDRVVRAFIGAMEKLEITKPSVLALDSLALLSSDEEVKAGFEKEHMKRAKDIKKLFRLNAILLNSTSATYLVTNHTIANIGDVFNPKTTGGGGGLKFQATIRLDLQNPKRLRDVDNRYVGVRITAFVEKNRISPPWRKVQMIIPFFEPLSPVSGLVALLLDLKVLEKTSGHRLAYQEKDTGIFAYATDLWKQDGSALELLTKFPDLIQTLDMLDLGRAKPGEQMAEDTDEEEGK